MFYFANLKKKKMFLSFYGKAQVETMLHSMYFSQIYEFDHRHAIADGA